MLSFSRDKKFLAKSRVKIGKTIAFKPILKPPAQDRWDKEVSGLMKQAFYKCNYFDIQRSNAVFTFIILTFKN